MGSLSLEGSLSNRTSPGEAVTAGGLRVSGCGEPSKLSDRVAGIVRLELCQAVRQRHIGDPEGVLAFVLPAPKVFDRLPSERQYATLLLTIWVVVKIRVPFWVP